MICRFKLAKASPSISSLSARDAYLQSIKINEEKVTNAFAQRAPSKKFTIKKNYSNESLNEDLIPRTDSFRNKKITVQKLLVGRGPEIVASKQFVNHFQVLSELQNLHMNIVKAKVPCTENSQIAKSKVLKKVSSIWPVLDAELTSKIKRPRTESLNNKKRPVPLPKPKPKEVEEDEIGTIKSNRLLLKQSAVPISPSHCKWRESEELQVYVNTQGEEIYQNTRNLIYYDHQNIYENLANNNVSDDVKAKMPVVKPSENYTHKMMTLKNSYNTYKSNTVPAEISNDDVNTSIDNDIYTPMSPTLQPDVNAYTHMKPSVILDSNIYTAINNIKHDLLVGSEPENDYLPVLKDHIYLPMKSRPHQKRLSCDILSTILSRPRKFSISAEYVNLEISKNFTCLKDNGRVKSIPNNFHYGFKSKQNPMHIRGVPGCIFENTDYQYIYELNPNAATNYPFTKKKQTETNMPCFCKDLSDYNIDDSQNIYLSCDPMEMTPETEDSEYCYVEDKNNPTHFYKVKTFINYSKDQSNIDSNNARPPSPSTDQPGSSEKKTQNSNIFKRTFIQLKQFCTD